MIYRRLLYILIGLLFCITITGCDLSSIESTDAEKSTEDDTVLDGVKYEAAFTRTIITKRHRYVCYYLFDDESKTVYYISMDHGEVLGVRKWSFEGDLDGQIVLKTDHGDEYYKIGKSMIETDVEGNSVKLEGSQWDSKYDSCSISEALGILKKYNKQKK